VRTTVLSFREFIASTLRSNFSSMNGPFLKLRGIAVPRSP